ncbi:hypothetical protein MLP_48170 [Microlunatus phosphovorus NM-1]|uniref:Uncharacterized protein n=1 Tax=Microlunatus phosphovorus (strain ATCC 700054 / DSM 10555 / JCM 9379 / NBRC 101784 / NCIMB 13414 / VKM Ac-1990 / NM-1) TaxID=1032480 RepID=F5XF93_MICPN|nr:hypothetical protein MLP_48170 [Microlunatus phosphovorus NM-1]
MGCSRLAWSPGQMPFRAGGATSGAHFPIRPCQVSHPFRYGEGARARTVRSKG